MNTQNDIKKVSGIITLAQVSDGDSAGAYFIETNYNEILRFYNDDGGEYKLQFSPPTLRFKIIDQRTSGTFVDITKWDFSILVGSEYQTLVNQESYEDQGFSYGKKTVDGNVNIDTTVLELDLLKFYEYLQENYPVLANSFLEGYPVLKFSFIKDDKVASSKIIVCNFGADADMAKFRIHSTGITAAIRDSSLNFSADGLTLHNGDFEIVTTTYVQLPKHALYSEEEFVGDISQYYEKVEREGEIIFEQTNDETMDTNKEYYVIEEDAPTEISENNKKYYVLTENGDYTLATIATDLSSTFYIQEIPSVFYADENGNLVLKGNVYADDGYFSGEINASSGFFSGELQASNGTIGGFIIEENCLYSSDHTIELISRKDGETSGHIKANSIELGTATLSDKIILKDDEEETTKVILSKPTEENGGLVLQSGYVKLKNTGLLNLGTVELFGGTGKTDGYIRSIYVDTLGEKQSYWRINEDGTAHFNDIYANNAHIQNSILETTTVQAVGSLMIFKNSWSIVGGHNTYTIELDKRNNLSLNDWIYSGNKYYQVKLLRNKIYYIKTEDSTFEKVPDEAVFDVTKEYFEDVNGERKTTDTDFHSYVGLNQAYDDDSFIITKIGASSTFSEIYQKATEAQPIVGRIYYTFSTTETFSTENYEKIGSIFIPTKDTEANTDKDYYTKTEYTDNEFLSENEYYYRTSSNDGGHIISLFGEEKSGITTPRDFAVGNSLTISSFQMLNNTTPQFTKRLILGNLQNSGIDSLSQLGGWGLYCDNVYLNGSLVTNTLTNNYAGISTTSSVSFQQSREGFSDSSNIVFWGGAQGTDALSIQNAPFQVTEGGTLYASNAIIENSLFTGTLHSADIHTAKIYGSGAQPGEPGLIIYDANSGISFRQIIESPLEKTEKEIYKIGPTGLSLGDNNFIKLDLNNQKAEFYGTFQTDAIDGARLTMKSSTLTMWHGLAQGSLNYLVDLNDGLGRFTFILNDYAPGANAKPKRVLELKKTKVTTLVTTEMKEDVWFGDAKMQYKNVENGYDLYVY